MKLLLLLFLLPVVTFAQVGTRGYLDEKNGFKDILLGSEITSIKHKMENTRADGKPDRDSCYTYSVEDTSMFHIGDIKLKAIGLSVFRNKVVSIILIFDKSQNLDMFTTLTKAYGVPIQENKYIRVYQWIGNKVDLQLNTKILQPTGNAVFTCKPLDIELAEFRQKQVANTAKDL
ncbi:hypothetical protein [Mucilaginibacter sp. L3T2-6]|uniref:hypothetical protein n=1 Tax=Mucilaginibacter sp. L3T2-6 TaxID=3062491 RepID=UPI0026753300|nr:hypothetical protein [Mucilaginibacter sp. L3T2-6]MDO3641960.1 hypothetical protein [Mucilaginibacter sp. L3T2-6]MDV6214362.1 hypothetical protein [Mucilaginibacter sp. L3T2-6]